MGKLLKIVRVGDEMGVVFSPEAMAELNIQVGDMIWVEDAGARKMALAECILREDHAMLADSRMDDKHADESDEAKFQRQIEVARQVMAKRKGALRELAK